MVSRAFVQIRLVTLCGGYGIHHVCKLGMSAILFNLQVPDLEVLVRLVPGGLGIMTKLFKRPLWLPSARFWGYSAVPAARFGEKEIIPKWFLWLQSARFWDYSSVSAGEVGDSDISP